MGEGGGMRGVRVCVRHNYQGRQAALAVARQAPATHMIAAAALLVSSSDSSAVTRYIEVSAAVWPPMARPEGR